jgi:hypothetical protein
MESCFFMLLSGLLDFATSLPPSLPLTHRKATCAQLLQLWQQGPRPRHTTGAIIIIIVIAAIVIVVHTPDTGGSNSSSSSSQDGCPARATDDSHSR